MCETGKQGTSSKKGVSLENGARLNKNSTLPGRKEKKVREGIPQRKVINGKKKKGQLNVWGRTGL